MTTRHKPSELLATLASSLPPEAFCDVLKRTVYPVLDRLPKNSRSNIISALEAVQQDCEWLAARVALVNHDAMRKKLQDDVKALQKHVKRDIDGWEIQSEMIEEISGSILGWLQTLWTVGVEDGVEPGLIHKCLKLCHWTTDQILSCDSQASPEDFQGDHVRITDKSGRKVYSDKYPSLYAVIAWVWRELLLVTLANNESHAGPMMDDIDRLQFSNDVEKQLRKGSEPVTAKRDVFYDGHWSDQTRAAASQLKQLFASRRIAVFERTPTFNTYRSLVTTFPDLKESLLDAARKHFFQDTVKKVAWGSAAQIFIHAGSREELDHIVEIIDKLPFLSSAARKAKCTIVTHFMTLSDEDRAKARLYLESGLDSALKEMWSEMEEAFPGLEEAFEYLDEMLDEKRLIKHESLSKPFDRKRDAILQKFIKIARTCSYGENDDYEDQYMRGVDEDDSDYENIHPDIADDIRSWVAILDKWPDVAEADEIRSIFTSTKNDPLYSVDGVVDMLTDRCESSGKHFHVAHAIEAARAAFGPTS